MTERSADSPRPTDRRHPLLDRKPSVAAAAYVAPSAVLIGDVSLAEGSSIWPAAVLRADLAPIYVGRFSNVQDSCVVHVDHDHPARIGEHVTLGHGAIVHGATIEDEVLIGMNATILTGAIVGHGSIVGAGALVTEHARIPAGSLVLGLPGRVARRLGPEAAHRNHEHALRYTALAREYQELDSSPETS